MISELVVALLMASAPDATRWPDAGAPSGLFQRDAGPDEEILIDPSCPADHIRTEKAAAAAARDRARDAVDVATRTLHDAEVIARRFFDEEEKAWVRQATAAATARLRDRVARHLPNEVALSHKACKALAGRDADACAAAGDDARTCRAVIALSEAEDCAALPAELRGACGALGGVACPPDDRLCPRLVGALEGAEAACVAGAEPSHCAWSVVARTLRDGRDACALVAPGAGRTTPTDRAIYSLCLAVAARQPDRCPPNLYMRPGDPAQATPLGRAVDATVRGGVDGPVAVVVVQTDTPAVCAASLRVVSRGLPVGAPDLRVVTTRSWNPEILRESLPRQVDAAAARAQVGLTCVPTAGW